MNVLFTVTILVSALCTATCDLTGHVTCDNQLSFFADGNSVPLLDYPNNWPEADFVSLPDTTQVLAFRCRDMGVIAGIKGAFSNGMKTDSTWKCSNQFKVGWNMVRFDDSSWEAATEYRNNKWQNKPATLNGVAEWIWTSAGIADSEVYCRKVVNTGRCAAGTYAPHETDNTKFMQCVHGSFVVRTCAPGTAWKQWLLTCDHQY